MDAIQGKNGACLRLSWRGFDVDPDEFAHDCQSSCYQLLPAPMRERERDVYIHRQEDADFRTELADEESAECSPDQHLRTSCPPTLFLASTSDPIGVHKRRHDRPESMKVWDEIDKAS